MRSFAVSGICTALLATSLAIPFAALAQTSPAAAPQPSAEAAPAQPAPRKPSPAKADTAKRDPMQRVEHRIAVLHKRLGITAEQQPQWEQFATVMRDNARNMQQAIQQRGSSAATMNAAENMQSYAQLSEQHAQDVQKLAAAFQPLYGSLSAAQKEAADKMFRNFAARQNRTPGHPVAGNAPRPAGK